MKEPLWLLRPVVDAIHDMQLREHGGPSGIRDEGMLESALARPRNAYLHGNADLFHLAAAYAFGIVRNHPYVDGNKRTAFLVSYVFLRSNGYELNVPEINVVRWVLLLAAGEVDEAGFANWLRDNVAPVGVGT